MPMNLTPAKALMAGLFLGPVCTFIASAANGYSSIYLVGFLLQNPILASAYFIFTNYIIHTAFAFLGGYTAARIAKQHEYYYAAAVAIVGIAADFLVFWLTKEVTDFQIQRPLDHYISLLATVPFAFGGAYVAFKKNNKTKPLTPTN